MGASKMNYSLYNPKIFYLFFLFLCTRVYSSAQPVEVKVGMILDLDASVGKMSKTCMLMAISDFYGVRNDTKYKIVPHIRDAKSDIVEAASAAIDLLKNVQVQAILGPQRSTQADFVIDIGNKAQVPIVSHATSPSLSHTENPYFIRASQCSSYHTKAVAEIVKHFGWREIVFIYEDNDYGSGVIPYLTDVLLNINTLVRYRSVISAAATNDQIEKELFKLMTMQTRVFVVHMLPSLASRFFFKAEKLGMMSKGYAWIITDVLTSLLDTMDSRAIKSMQGVVGIKPFVPRSNHLENFTKRWKERYRQENPNDYDRFELNVFGLWAYDSVYALGMALEKMSTRVQEFDPSFTRMANGSLTDLDSIGTSKMGSKLLPLLKNINLKGLSGDFHIIDGKLQPSAYQIVNIIGKGEREIGFWTPQYGISNNLMGTGNLSHILWPGDTIIIPKGWEIPNSERKLRVGVPAKGGFSEFVNVRRDPQTNDVIATGFCVEVFKSVIDKLPYAIPYEFIPFETHNRNYDDLVYQIVEEKYDAVVGDVTIVANRSRFVDFTLPFTESGVSMVVPVKDDERKNAWIFMKPLTMELWVTTGVFFIFIGFVVWVLEHRINKEFRGPIQNQVGMIFWFSFSTLVFSHKEKLISNLSRFVVIVWIFVVLVLTSSYTASLTSMLTVQQLQPTVTNIHDLLQSGELVGYQAGSFIDGFLQNMKFDVSKFRMYNNSEEYNEALIKGSKMGGVGAIVDELPYLRLFLAKYCNKYTMVGPTYKTAGFGFAFPRGSPLVVDISRAILDVTQGDEMMRISREWLKEEVDCPGEKGDAKVTSQRLTLDSFKGLFLIAGTTSCSALIAFLFIFLYDNKEILTSENSMLQKIYTIAKNFDTEKENVTQSNKTPETNEGLASKSIIEDYPQSPAISISCHTEGIFSQDEGFSTTEPGTPIHDSTLIT